MWVFSFWVYLNRESNFAAEKERHNLCLKKRGIFFVFIKIKFYSKSQDFLWDSLRKNVTIYIIYNRRTLKITRAHGMYRLNNTNRSFKKQKGR